MGLDGNAAGGFSLAAVAPAPRGDWTKQVADLLRQAEFSVVAGRQIVKVWRSRGGSPLHADGAAVQRLWLGRGIAGLAVTSNRWYFNDDGSLDDRPEREIPGSLELKRPSVEIRVGCQISVLEALGSIAGVDRVRLERMRMPEVTVSAGAVRRRLSELGTFNDLYRSAGFARVPKEWRINLCLLDGAPAAAARDLERALARAADRVGCPITVAETTDDQIVRHLDRVKSGDYEVRPSSVLLFMLPRKSSPPSTESWHLMNQLDRAGVRFRRAYADDDRRVSAVDQLPSLLMAVGGAPHVVEVRYRDEPVWSVGVDLSHDVTRRRSRLAVTLVDPEGSLRKSWHTSHPLDETIDSAKLATALNGVREEVPTGRAILILRDGRLFEGERGETYLNLLGPRATLVEARKGGNPLILDGSQCASGVPAGVVPDTDTVFAVLAPPRRGSLPRVVKATTRPSWNGLKLEPAELVGLLAALAAAPGLGLHKHSLPAPLYWADGIAGVGIDDLRFAGNAAVELA